MVLSHPKTIRQINQSSLLSDWTTKNVWTHQSVVAFNSHEYPIPAGFSWCAIPKNAWVIATKLLGVIPTPLKKYEFVSWDYSSQYMESHKTWIPNHQPEKCGEIEILIFWCFSPRAFLPVLWVRRGHAWARAHLQGHSCPRDVQGDFPGWFGDFIGDFPGWFGDYGDLYIGSLGS